MNMFFFVWLAALPPRFANSVLFAAATVTGLRVASESSSSSSALLFGCRDIHGAHKSLVPDLLTTDRSSYRNFLRMDDESFRILISTVSAKLTKSCTIMRDSISANERLSVTLRYLATGEILLHASIT